MELKQLLVDSKTTWVEFPGLEGFEVELANLSRKELNNLRKDVQQTSSIEKQECLKTVLMKTNLWKNLQQRLVKNWKGLKLGYLEDLVLVDLANQDKEKELPFSDANAEHLVENSSEFDNWLNDVVFDLDNFRSRESGETKETTKTVSG